MPEPADVQVAQQIIAVAPPLDIEAHDHMIVGNAGHASLKGLKLI